MSKKASHLTALLVCVSIKIA